MPLIVPVRGFTPQVGRECFLADNATLVGDVIMGDQCSVWFNTVIRGDVNSIRIGNRVNIQDGSVLHTLYQKSTIEIGDDVSIGHNVTVHGAKIRDYALIGMGSVIMDDAEVGEGALVAAGSVVLARTKIGPNELWGGAPAKFIKMVEPEKAQEMNRKIAHNYLMYSNGTPKDARNNDRSDRNDRSRNHHPVVRWQNVRRRRNSVENIHHRRSRRRVSPRRFRLPFHRHQLLGGSDTRLRRRRR